MISDSVVNIEERFARNGDYMMLANAQSLRRLKTERKLLRSPTKNPLSNLAPFLTCGNFCADRSGLLSGRIFECNVNVAVCFNSKIDHPAC